jgi:hypothetical protein
LGVHRDNVNSHILRIQGGLDLLDEKEVDEKEKRGGRLRFGGAFSPAGVNKKNSSGTSSKSSSSLTTHRHTRNKSSRYNMLVDVEPVAADVIRRRIEQSLIEKGESKFDNKFTGWSARASETPDLTVHMRSWFDSDNFPTEPKICMKKGDTPVHMEKKKNNRIIAMEGEENDGWRGSQDSFDDRQFLTTIVRCRRELSLIAEQVHSMSRIRLIIQGDLKEFTSKLNRQIHYHRLVLQMVEDVQTVDNMDSRAMFGGDIERDGAGGGPGSGEAKNGMSSLTISANALTDLWRTTILSTDECLAQAYLQMNMTTLEEDASGAEHGGGGGGSSVVSASEGTKTGPKTMNLPQARAKKMKSFGLLQGSSSSVDMLMVTKGELKKMMLSTSAKSDPYETYPTMLMMEMVADCLKMRLNHQLALHGHVQQCYDTCITSAETNLPPLLTKYDLTYAEFRGKILVDFHDQLDEDIKKLVEMDTKDKEAFGKALEHIRTCISQELKEHAMTRKQKKERIEQLMSIMSKVQSSKQIGEDDREYEVDLAEKLMIRLKR